MNIVDSIYSNICNHFFQKSGRRRGQNVRGRCSPRFLDVCTRADKSNRGGYIRDFGR